MRFYRYQYAPGESRQINASGRFVRGIDGAERYQIQLDNGAATDFETGIGFAAPEPFQSVRVSNTSPVPQVIEVAVSEGAIDDSRFVGTGNINIGNTAAADHTTHPVQTISAANEVLPINGKRRSAIVQCDGAVYIDSAANGIEVRNFTWESRSALTLVPVSGSVEVRVLEEIDA